MFTQDEKKLLKMLVEQELAKFKADESEIRPVVPQTLAIEEKYEDFLDTLIKKL